MRDYVSVQAIVSCKAMDAVNLQENYGTASSPNNVSVSYCLIDI